MDPEGVPAGAVADRVVGIDVGSAELSTGGSSMSLTPMMRQYQEIKATLEDTLLMFRLGDFYELFFEDAVVASRALDITLTGRDAGEAGRIPMCGVPYHALESYLERLIDHGFRVAICEQVEDPKTAKGLVQREIVRIVTPGTALANEQANRFLASFVAAGDKAGVCFVDVGTGEVLFGEGGCGECVEQLRRLAPIELLMAQGAEMPEPLARYVSEEQVVLTRRQLGAKGYLEKQYLVGQPEVLGIDTASPARTACDMALAYIEETQKTQLAHLQAPRPLFEADHMLLTQAAILHLELTATARDRARKGSLLDLLDETATAAGSRMLKAWLERPLCKKADIEARHDAVDYFYQDFILREEVREVLRGIHDMARLLARFSFGSANARDLLALAQSLRAARQVVDIVRTPAAPSLLMRIVDALPDLVPLYEDAFVQLVDDPPATIRDGGMFRDGVHAELDRLRSLQSSGRAWLRELEQSERERTGIKSLKVGYNKVFGYYIEVSKANLASVPAEYERRQTLAAAERFVLPALKEREAEIVSAQERAVAFEEGLFRSFCDRVLAASAGIQQWAEAIAQIDVLATLAHVANKRRYVRPEMVDGVGIEIEAGRHPVVEAHVGADFVPNDTLLTPEEHIILLTGPNMGGKSTYMRQTAVICAIAQMGGFVPATRARIGIVDKLFTRIGASDDLGRGQSTFMVEMTELAEILRLATGRSLILLDEIGRGTSTYDGLSIAEAVLEDLATRSERPLTMFATHYHELTAFSESFSCVRNQSLAVEETGSGIRFLHTVMMRPSDRSYGIQVARLAGLPKHVIDRAQELLLAREHAQVDVPHSVREAAATAAVNPPATQHEARLPGGNISDLALFAGPYRSFVEWLAGQDVMRMTPLDAMNEFYRAIEKARELVSWDTSN